MCSFLCLFPLILFPLILLSVYCIIFPMCVCSFFLISVRAAVWYVLHSLPLCVCVCRMVLWCAVLHRPQYAPCFKRGTSMMMEVSWRAAAAEQNRTEQSSGCTHTERGRKRERGRKKEREYVVNMAHNTHNSAQYMRISEPRTVNTIDGQMPTQYARTLAFRMYAGGFIALPWLWIVNVWMFFPHAPMYIQKPCAYIMCCSGRDNTNNKKTHSTRAAVEAAQDPVIRKCTSTLQTRITLSNF